MPKQIDQLIINSPYEEPSRYWSYRRDAREFTLKEGRRPAGYLRASEKIRAVNGHGEFGRWAAAVSRHPGDIHGVLARFG